MRTTTEHLAIAKAELAAAIDKATHNPGVREDLQKLIAKFTAQAIRDDRTHRYTKDGIAKITDVFFNEKSDIYRSSFFGSEAP